MDPEPKTNSVFVYGTLKRGHVREKCWPKRPERVVPSQIRGDLYDLGAYPALCHGDGWVAGERWELAQQDVAEVLKMLDRIEVYGQDGEPNLYVRDLVACMDFDGSTHSAYAYFFAQPHQLRSSLRVAPDQNGVLTWSPRHRQKTLSD